MKQISYFLLCIVLFSCGNKQEKSTENKEIKPLKSIVKKHLPVENVNPIYKKDVENWQELKAVNRFLTKFEKVSPNEALSNALELRDLVAALKDSVKPKIFNIPPFNARINILNNEVLRLADLTLIPAIKTEEINLQVDKTIAAFSAVNSKINTILSQKQFEDAIDINLDFIGIDATKIDSISKKSIDERTQLLEKREVFKGAKNKRKPIKKKKL